MSGDLLASAVSLIKQNYHPLPKLADRLRGLLQAALTVTQSTQGKICLNPPELGIGNHHELPLVVDANPCEPCQLHPFPDCRLCMIFMKGNGHRPVVGDECLNGAQCARWGSALASNLTIPLQYQGAATGLMILAAIRVEHYTPAHRSASQWIAREIAYQAKRYELDQTIKATFGKELTLIGTSDALRRVDEFIEKASSVNLPALILGEFGSEKKQVAYALHLGGRRRHHPFVEVRCAALEPQTLKQVVSGQLRQAAGGTILFNGIDELASQLQCHLSEVIESELGDWTSRSNQTEPVGVRLVASASREVDQLADGQDVHHSLLEKFDFLAVHLAPLRKRMDDLDSLIEYFLNKHAPLPNRRFSNEVLDVFRGYDWPGNLYELERVIARLAVMSHEEVIGLSDVVAHAPKLAERWRELNRATVAAGQPPWDDNGVRARGAHRLLQVERRVIQLARHLIKGEFADIKRFHPSLQKALEYVVENLHEAISLHELTRHACVSASHLSYLFQRTLGVSFKSFLAILRVEEAKQLLVEKPYMRITEISFEVGFGDLSHFERMFKRLVGQTPRGYRQAALGAQEPENSPTS